MGQRAGYDAVVIGAGPAGCAAAVTLARGGRRVALVVESRRPRAFGVGEGAPPGLDRAVDEVFGPGSFVATEHLRSLGNRTAWGTGELLVADFMLNPFGLGWHLDRVVLDDRLLAAATAAEGVTVMSAHDEHRAAGRVVIDATGRRADYARASGARRITTDRLVAVYARSSWDDDATTTVEAAETGWWYTCPIPRQRRVVAFLTDGDLLAAALRTGHGFHHRATRTAHIAALLGDEVSAGPLVVAAGSAQLDAPVGRGWLATGDAAASFDPLSSQGILTAVLMGREAARRVDEPEIYAARYRTIVTQYEADLLATYRREQRWPTSPFWARRHSQRAA